MYACSAVPAEPGSASNCPCWPVSWTALTGRSLSRSCQTHVPSLNPMPPSGRAPTGRSLFFEPIWIRDKGEQDADQYVPCHSEERGAVFPSRRPSRDDEVRFSDSGGVPCTPATGESLILSCGDESQQPTRADCRDGELPSGLSAPCRTAGNFPANEVASGAADQWEAEHCAAAPRNYCNGP